MNTFNNRVKTLVSLMEEDKRGFDFSEKKGTMNTHNFQVARTFLKADGVKEKINEIRHGKERNKQDAERHLVSLYVMSRNINKPGRKEEARTLLKNAGVATKEKEEGGMEVSDDLVKKATKTFNTFKAQHRPPTEQPEDEKKEVAKPAEKRSREEEDDDDKTPFPSDDPEERSKKIRMPSEPEESGKEATPQENSKTIKNLMNDTLSKIDQKIKEYQESPEKDVMKRRNLNRLNTLKATVGKELNKLSSRAVSEPSQSDYLTTKAKNRADYLLTRADIVPVKGAIRRVGSVPGRAVKKTKEKGEAIAHRAKTWADTSKVGQKFRKEYTTAKEMAQATGKKVMGKIISKGEERNLDRNYKTIKNAFGDEAANKYKETRDPKVLERAKEKKEENRKTMRDAVKAKKRGPMYSQVPPTPTVRPAPGTHVLGGRRSVG